ncbi:MAG: flagellin [Crenarchaeota archaeon]|nr:MAG: flagellin [Thermoproteota archaeon]RDJ34545.1 MAG: flagellin [Thermoproteota archaeon]RDJ35935.1 MAG: flagellin [Thermoproteota archaeon]RDJ38512.1 MAG: flagellin [Thermoproteota archaeon]
MASGLIGEAILIIASVIVAGSVAGVVLSQIGVFESSITQTSEDQKDKLLTKIKIIYVANSTDNDAEVWVKNIGKNPITSLDKIDVYFGPVNAVQRFAYTVGDVDETWEINGGIPSPAVWQQMDTLELQLDEDSLAKSTTYEVRVITPQGVSDEYIFSIP